MFDGYDDATVDETLSRVEDWDVEKLERFLAYEASHKDRVGVVDPLESTLGIDAADAHAEPDTVAVTVPNGVNYGGGLWFDDTTNIKHVDYTTRIEQAINDGSLIRVDD
jgi:hypothetical protein